MNHCSDCGNPGCPKVSPVPNWPNCPADIESEPEPESQELTDARNRAETLAKQIRALTDKPALPIARTTTRTQPRAARQAAGRRRLDVWLPLETWQRLEALCRDSGYSRTELVAALIDGEWSREKERQAAESSEQLLYHRILEGRMSNGRREILDGGPVGCDWFAYDLDGGHSSAVDYACRAWFKALDALVKWLGPPEGHDSA